VVVVVVAIRRVYPSGADWAAIVAPVFPAAPGRLSTMTGCPRLTDNCSAMTRAAMSTLPPAGHGTISLTACCGYTACAQEPALATAQHRAAHARRARRIGFLMPAPLSLDRSAARCRCTSALACQ